MPTDERDIFEACLAIVSEVGREAFLEHACAGDEEIADRVRRLLSAHERPEVLERPPRESGPSRPPMPERIGPYRVLDKIGEGGMGVVYLGELTHPVRRRVAIKVLRDPAGSTEVLARFEAERQALAMMAHPSIARIVFADVRESGQPYFVMDYVHGLPISEFCDTRSVDVEGRLRLFLQVCSAVRHAHQRGIIHRDLKPSNILVTEESGVPTPKIIDFGVAKATHLRLTERTLHTRMGQAVGTPEYMSPEQADGSVLEVDTRSDVYSLGVVLYELLTGERPFDFSDPRHSFSQIQKILRERPPRAPSAAVLLGGDPEIARRRATTKSELTSLLGGDLDAVVLKSLAKEVGRRYASVDRLSEDVQRYLERRPVTARPDTFVYRTSRFIRRNRPTVVATGLVAASLVVGTVASMWQADRAGQQAAIAEAARDEARAALAVSREISDFVVSLFGIAEDTEDLELRGRMLSGGIVRAEAYSGRPSVQSLIFAALSEAHTQYSEYGEAERLAERALATIREVEPEGSAVEVHALLALGAALRGRAADDSAAAVFAGAEPLAERYLDRADPLLARVYGWTGLLASAAGRFGEAQRTLSRAIDVLSEQDPEHPLIIGHLLTLGRAHWSAGELDSAERIFRESVERGEQAEPSGGRLRTQAQLALADLLAEEPMHADEAEALYRDALSGLEGMLGPESTGLAHPLNNLGWLLAENGEFDQAFQLVSRTVNIFEAAWGVDNLGTARQREILARVHLRAGLDDAGYRLIDDVVRVKLSVGAPAPAVVTLSETGSHAVSRGHLEQAERYARQLEHLVEGLEATSRHAPRSPTLWAELYMARGDYERAEKELEAALQLAERRPEVPIVIRRPLEVLAMLYDAWGRPDQAASVRRRLEEVSSGGLVPGSGSVGLEPDSAPEG